MDPLTLSLLLGAGASILSGFLGSNAATQASSTQAQAIDKQTQLEAAALAQARSDAAPWLAAGQTALQQYMGELGLTNTVSGAPVTTTTPSVTSPSVTTPAVYNKKGKLVTPARTTPGVTTPGVTTTTPSQVPFVSQFQKTPGYDFQVQQADKNTVDQMRALGLGGSGAALKALTRVNSGLANQAYQQYLDRLSGVSTGGQTTEGNSSAQQIAGASSLGQSIANSGAATASGYVGSANAITGALGNFSNNAGTALGNYNQDWQRIGLYG